jgi:hypothetical protein
MAAPSSTLTTGLNSYYLIQLIESLSQLEIGYNPDVDDINQDLVLQFIKEGYQRILSLENGLPWFQATYQFSTIVNIHSYASGFSLIAAYSNPDASIVAGSYPLVSPDATALNLTSRNIKEIISVTNNTNAGNELIYLDQSKAESIWVGVNDIAGIPTYWTLWNNQINLYPKPDQEYQMTIRGYRQPGLAWLTDSNNSESTNYVDLDNEYQVMLVNFVLSRIFQFQEDPEMANVYMRHYEQGVAIANASLTAPNRNQPLILSGGLQLTGNNGYWWSDAGMQVLPGNPSPLGRMF